MLPRRYSCAWGEPGDRTGTIEVSVNTIACGQTCDGNTVPGLGRHQERGGEGLQCSPHRWWQQNFLRCQSLLQSTRTTCLRKMVGISPAHGGRVAAACENEGTSRETV